MSNSLLVSPDEAQRLLQRGYTYVDVRSELEFTRGHPPGAFNIPLSRVEGDRLVDNPDFERIIRAVFRTVDPLIIGCHSGARSRVAIGRLKALGFSELRELEHGFCGARDAFGRRLPGWLQRGMPVEQAAPEERSYAALARRASAQECADDASPSAGGGVFARE